MGKKSLIIIFSIIFLLSLNCSMAVDVEGSTDANSISDSSVLALANDIENQSLKAGSSLIDTHMDVASNTTLDVVGDDFKVKLLDNDNKSISNAKITFSVNGINYKNTTNNDGIASLQIRLRDGSYNMTTKFEGDNKYKSCSNMITITMNNTKVVKEGLSGAEIQKIIDNAKANNVILFTGSTYENVNLVINKRLTLLSKCNTVLISESNSPAILVTGKGSSYTTIDGFNIQGNGNGIEIKNSDYVTIINNDIKTKSRGIVASDVDYLNVTKNNLVGNGKDGITLISADDSHVYNNKINSNGKNGIQVAKSDKIYIYDNFISSNGGNGVFLTNKIDNVIYGVSKNVHIDKNTINKNKGSAVLIENAGDNISINSNMMSSNWEDGISISKIGTNKIQSNVITDNHGAGLNFIDEYTKPKSQDISYNAIFGNVAREVEAKDYGEGDEVLSIGENWYSDANTLCPKIKTKNLKFVVKQIGPNSFQALFLDSKGNIASLLPDRTLSFNANGGKSIDMTISGGSAVFTVDANDGDIVKATVDYSPRDNIYDSNAAISNPINGETPSYSYPNIEYDSIYGGYGDGDGTGEGSGGPTNKGNGTSYQESSDFTGNSTTSRNVDPGKNAANQVNDVSQSYDTPDITSQASASDSSSGDTGSSGSQSVVKRIILDEDEFFKITGISFIILLIILTIGFYYRDDIKEMKSKM